MFELSREEWVGYPVPACGLSYVCFFYEASREAKGLEEAASREAKGLEEAKGGCPLA